MCQGPRGGCARGLARPTQTDGRGRRRPGRESRSLPKTSPPSLRAWQSLLGIASLPLLPRPHQPVMEWLVKRVRKAVDEAVGAEGTEDSGRAVSAAAVQGAVHGAVQVAASRGVRVAAERPGVRAVAVAAMAVALLTLAQMAAAEARRPSAAALRKGERAMARAEAASGQLPSPASPQQQQQQPSSSSKKKRRRSLPERGEAQEMERAAKRSPQGGEAEEDLRATKRSATNDAAGSSSRGLPVTKAASVGGSSVKLHVSSGPEEVGNTLSLGTIPPSPCPQEWTILLPIHHDQGVVHIM